MSVDYTFLCDKNIFFFFLYTTTLTPTLSSELYPGSYFILFRQRGGGGCQSNGLRLVHFIFSFTIIMYIFSFFSSYYICFYMKHLKPIFSGEFVFLIEGHFYPTTRRTQLKFDQKRSIYTKFHKRLNELSTKYTYRLCMCTLYLQTTTWGALSFLKYILS